jgi:mono/diheme cytochrome c family protein
MVLATVSAAIYGWSLDLVVGHSNRAPVAQKNAARARELFASIVPVFKHPRCLNCHATGDFPRQGDDNHVHTQNVRRGPDGKGKYGQKCSACHQEQNVAGLNMPPGAPNWHLPPANMPMIWEGKTPGEICRQIKDPKQNNGKSLAQIIEHVTADKLVMWGWDPGEGRTLPPMGHDEFARRFQEWAGNGAACPQ